MSDKSKQRISLWLKMLACGCGLAIVSPLNKQLENVFLYIMQVGLLFGLVYYARLYWKFRE